MPSICFLVGSAGSQQPGEVSYAVASEDHLVMHNVCCTSDDRDGGFDVCEQTMLEDVLRGERDNLKSVVIVCREWDEEARGAPRSEESLGQARSIYSWAQTVYGIEPVLLSEFSVGSPAEAVMYGAHFRVGTVFHGNASCFRTAWQAQTGRSLGESITPPGWHRGTLTKSASKR